MRMQHQAMRQQGAYSNKAKVHKGRMVRPEQLVAAVESLYNDRIRPDSRILKRRLVELNRDSGLRTVDIDSAALRAAVAATPGLSVLPDDIGDWIAVLCNRRPNFIDAHEKSDAYAPCLWEAFHHYVSSLSDPNEYRLPSSRYACAHELQARALPFFEGLTLGSLCHIVQLAVSKKNILGYRDGALVPYAMSNCLIKKKHAECMLPCAPAHADGVLPCADWDTVRACLSEIMAMALHSDEGFERLANVKRIFRSKYHVELSETMLGHTKLSELLQDPRLADICAVELRNGVYAVVPQKSVGQCAIDSQMAAGNMFDVVQIQCIHAEPLWPLHNCENLPCNIASVLSNESFGSFPCNAVGNMFGGLHLQFASEALAPPKQATLKVPQAPWQLSPSTLSKEGSVTKVPGLNTLKNTFIHVPITPVTPAVGAKRRSRSCPKDMWSKKDEWEVACHVLSYQHSPVQSKVRTIEVEKNGAELGLDVSRDGEALLVEGVNPGAVQWWNNCHPEECVMPGDRILEVNGVAGDPLVMIQACRTAETLVLTVQPCAQVLPRKLSEPSLPSPVLDLPVQTPTFDSMPVCSYALPCGERQGLQLSLAGFL